MTRYQALPLTTPYWKPGADYLNEIAKAAAGKVADGDFVVVSEKAVSTAEGNMLDESRFQPGLSARFLARYWMRVGWGYFFGVACGFGVRLLGRLRNYPEETGSRHKQAALQYAGLRQALMFGSEGGIDGSNLPFSLVSLPLKNSGTVAQDIQRTIWRRLSKKVVVIIVDTDKTYSFRNFHFTPRPNPMRGIHSKGGLVAYVVGRILGLRRRPTPLAVAGAEVCGGCLGHFKR
jgi:F420-0:gamma-glutamyl ligase-like protein